MMQRVLCGVLFAVSVVGCVAQGDERDSETDAADVDDNQSSPDVSAEARYTDPRHGCCPTVMPNEPLGQICTLSSELCLPYVSCGYKCTVILEPWPE